MATMKTERAETRAEKLTKTFVAALACPESGDFTVYDAEQPGLALRLSPGSKTWIVRRKLRGQSFRHVLGRFPEMTLERARKEAKIAIGAFEQGKHPTLEREARKAATNKEWLATRFTVGEMWTEYRKQPRDAKPFSANTMRDFKRVENWMKTDPLWSTPIATLSEVEALAAFKRAGAAAAKSPRAKNGGKTTANLIFRNLRSATQYAIRHKRLASDSNIFSAALENNWHKPRARQRTLVTDKDSLRRWWSALESQRAKGHANAKNRASAILADYQALVLLWGGRRTETLQLRWDDIDFEAKTVRFAADITKARREHNFPLAPLAESILRRLQRLRDAWSPGSDWVFAATKAGTKTKEKTHIKEPVNAMREVADEAGVPFSTHDLRRTFSNLLSSSAGVGAEQIFVKLAMNHSVDDNVTAKHYMDKVEQLRPHYEALENVILEKVGVAVAKKIMVDADAYQRFLDFEANKAKPRRRPAQR
ncbi:integrase family protein [Paucibacter sp. R3-3]|uniref:Integrase family protein n=1 Tax=Roseateles agri TaxID=3098619 RepID=A0ABU5DNS2_9BURK|nr:integrase family protein [Paucibacter sp. R3-3]MDY0747956.1 integrase family protein [Paucibacter sp. R3-3]